MPEEFNIIKEGGKTLIQYNTNIIFQTLSIIRREDKLTKESFLFNEFSEEYIIGSLLTARFKIEENLKLTDYQEALRKETGSLGRMYIGDLLTKVRETLDEPKLMPFSGYYDLTFDQRIERYDDVLTKKSRKLEIKTS